MGFLYSRDSVTLQFRDSVTLQFRETFIVIVILKHAHHHGVQPQVLNIEAYAGEIVTAARQNGSRT